MASKTIVLCTDDIDGTEDATEVSFGLEGTEYAIDLSKSNADVLRQALAPFIEKARKKSVKKSVKTATTKRSRGSGAKNLAEIRKWGKENGFKLNDRGRIPAEVMKAYDSMG